MLTGAAAPWRFSKINVVEVTLKETRKGLTEELSKIDGVERVDTGVDGAFQKLLIQTREVAPQF